MTRQQLSKKTNNALANMDMETKSILYVGAGVSQLGSLFKMDNRTVARRLEGLEPVGVRAGYAIYNVKEAAQRLVEPTGDFEARIKRMKPEDLPPELLKAFWAGLRERDKWLVENGEYWETGEVLAHLNTTFKTARIELELLRDTVNEQYALTPEQMEIIDSAVDETLRKLAYALTEQFKTSQSTPEEKGRARAGQESERDEGDQESLYPESEEDDDFFSVDIGEASDEEI